MTIVNLTDVQYARLIEPPSLIEQVITNPLIIPSVILLIAVFIFFKYKKGTPSDPSTKPWWGLEVRGKLLQKVYKKRMNTLGKSCRILLEKGIAKVGMITAIEYDKQLFTKQVIDFKTKKKIHVPSHYYRIDRFKFRKCGTWSRIKALFGFGYSYMTVTPDSYKTRRTPTGKVIFNLDPSLHLISDSDVWTVSDRECIDSNNEFVLKSDLENIHGYGLDMLRRLSINQPTVSSNLERLSHEAKIKEEERKSKTAPYS